MLFGRLHIVGLVAALPMLGMVGCSVQHPGKAATTRALAAPPLTAPYAKAGCAGNRVYRFDDDASRVLALVGKAGVLSGAGHVHVVAVKRLRGFARTGARAAKADVLFPVRAMRVDPPAIRSALGGEYAEVHMDAQQRTDTRKNMLISLDAHAYPWVHLAISRANAAAQTPLQIKLTLHGQTRAITLPAAPATIQSGAQRLIAEGSFHIRQSDFGIEPYAILLGALRVKDELQIRYHLVFERWHPPDTLSCSTQN